MTEEPNVKRDNTSIVWAALANEGETKSVRTRPLKPAWEADKRTVSPNEQR